MNLSQVRNFQTKSIYCFTWQIHIKPVDFKTSDFYISHTVQQSHPTKQPKRNQNTLLPVTTACYLQLSI